MGGASPTPQKKLQNLSAPIISVWLECWHGEVQSSWANLMRTLTTIGDKKVTTPGNPTKDEERLKRRFLFWFGIILCIGIAFVLNRSASIRFQSDLFARWYASRMLLEKGRDLYDVQNGEEVVAYKQIQTSALEAGFYYPAHLLVFLAPLSRLPFEFAHLTWTTAVLLFSFIGLWIVMQILDWPPTANQLAIFSLMALLFIPTVQNAIWSQFDSIVVISLALAYLYLVKGKYFLAGVWASAASLGRVSWVDARCVPCLSDISRRYRG